MDIDRWILEIKNDKSSGASELMVSAVECVQQFSEDLSVDDSQKYYEGMVNVGRQLIEAQPSMAPLFNGVNSILLDFEKASKNEDSPQLLKEVVRLTAKKILDSQKKALSSIQDHVLDLIQNGQTILTHSYSSTVINSLIFAKQNGKEFQVIVTESRPLFEGRRTADILAKEGIEMILIADMAAFHLMDDVDMVITGCDCICSKGVVNKIGTRGLAMASSCQNKPFYIICERSKFLPSKYMNMPHIDEKDPSEILEEKGKIKIRNFYFDLTPYDYISGIITEEGLMEKDKIRNVLASLPVCECLLDM
jgi:eIF-2B alpha/beta/delta-like uncharacterized protein